MLQQSYRSDIHSYLDFRANTEMWGKVIDWLQAPLRNPMADTVEDLEAGSYFDGYTCDCRLC